jgi:PH (Pleckstrin Homology) domain-containing protein
VAAGGAFANDQNGAGAFLVLGAAFLVGVIVTCRRRQPMAYRVGQLGIVVEDRRGEAEFAGPVALVPGAQLGMRMWGSGGLYGYFGRFRLRAGGGGVRAFLTRRTPITVLRVGETVVAVSPVDPIAFEQEVRGADA